MIRAGVRAVQTIQGGKNELRIRFGCGLDSRIYGIHSNLLTPKRNVKLGVQSGNFTVWSYV
jgi:hypothetical protein